MWKRPHPPVLARMPTTRVPPHNPRAAAPAPGAKGKPPAPAAEPATSNEAADAIDEAEKAARAGGFHESSYELKDGLDVSESDWPDDVTIPGALGDR